MVLRLGQVNVKARDDSALGRFWAAALGWTAVSAGAGATSVRPAGATWPDPAAVWIDVIAVPDPATLHDHAHIELATTSAAHHAELVTRLQELGATAADAGRDDLPWTTLTDPEGNGFCVREPSDRFRDTGPIAAVVVDCADPRAMARFWGEAMDWTAHVVTDEHALLRPTGNTGPFVEFLRTPHLKNVSGRAHLDLVPYPLDSKAAEVTRLAVLGATPADVGQGNVPWTVLADPEGHEFCVLGPA